MKLTLRKIDKENYDEVIGLSVSNNQIGFIESTKACLEEAREFNFWRPIAIYEEENIIGLAMYGLFEDEGIDGRVWFDRFMIDEKYQGKGYGKRSFNLILEKIHSEYDYDEIFLSIYDNNTNAIKMYEDRGFRFNGELDINGEKVMVINMKK
ncbi:MAG: GNAT family N-acetyltransferase [Romboutsia sp.]